MTIVNINYNIKIYFRLGKYQENDNVIRPLTIILNSDIEINNIIQNANKLKNSKFKNISILKNTIRLSWRLLKNYLSRLKINQQQIINM